MVAIRLTTACLIVFSLVGCAPQGPVQRQVGQPGQREAQREAQQETQCPAVLDSTERAAAVVAIGALLDAWHAAAGRADEEAYFAQLSEAAVFLGTDATERWDKAAFRQFAHPHFAKGKAWSFQAVRRDISLTKDGHAAWFDEDLDTPNLGPARGSGVVIRRENRWLIVHYNLAITVPNERFKAVKQLLEQPPSADAAGPPQEREGRRD